jgi:hypothetical protein
MRRYEDRFVTLRSESDVAAFVAEIPDHVRGHVQGELFARFHYDGQVAIVRDEDGPGFTYQFG